MPHGSADFAAGPRATPAAAGPRPTPAVLAALLLVSGVVALVYQSLWMRQLSLILGSTTYAIGTVLAAFMAGLGVGTWVFGRRADHSQDPLRLYASLEVAIGVLGLASPFVLAQGNGLYGWCYARLHDAPALLASSRFLIGFGFVAAPAFLMGGTLPVVTRAAVGAPDAVGRSVGLLYATNTMGAAVGALALPFALLPALGMRATLLACGVTNLAIAGVAGAVRRTPAGSEARRAAGARAVRARRRGILAAFFVSGFVALALEILWNRFFTMYVGSSIYSFAMLLFLYLAGTFMGGLLFVRVERRFDARDVFAACLGLLVVDLALTVPLMDRVVYVQAATLAACGIGFAAFQLATAATAAAVILPPTLLLGIAFPAVVKASSRAVETVGEDLGVAYLVNTAGTTVGALAASFVLIPRLGVERTLDVLTLLVAAAVVPMVGRRAPAVAATVTAIATVPLLVPRWDWRLMHTGLSRNPAVILGYWREGTFAQAVGNLEVRDVREGVDATVSVAGTGTQLSLFVNGKPDASNGVDMATQVLIGHLPLLVHPAPHDVLVIGMGSGVTLGAVARHPVTAIDLVEIAPEVLDLGDRWFRAENGGALHDGRVRVHVEDGRNFVGFDTARSYDVVISEPSNPWMTGVANLFTDEFFSQVHRRLRPGGVLGQWFHFYSMGADEIRTLVGTLHRRFRSVYVFALDRAAAGDLLLLASDGALDFARAFGTLGGDGAIADDLRRFGFDGPDALLRGFVLSGDNVDRFVGGAPLNSDDRPVIELRAPRAVFRDTVDENLQALLAASGGARLADSAAAGRQAMGAVGLRRVFTGYRMETGDPAPDAAPPRTLLAESRFEDDAGRSLVVLSAPGLRAASELARLASDVAEAAVVPDGETRVDDRPALAYRVPDDRHIAVAWNCPRENASHAATVGGTGDHPASDLLGRLRCDGRAAVASP